MKKILLTLTVGMICLLTICKAEETEPISAQEKIKVTELIAVLKNEMVFKANPAQAADAIISLGKIGAVEAIPVLIEHIDFCDEKQNVPSRPYSPENCRIVVQALVNIGKASVQPVIEACKKEDGRLRLICMAAVIRTLDGRNIREVPRQEPEGFVALASNVEKLTIQ